MVHSVRGRRIRQRRALEDLEGAAVVLARWGPLPLRLALGVVFVNSGLGKWRGGINGTGEWMRGLGLPFPQATARLVATTELLGGAALLLGFATRLVGAALAVNMAVATRVEREQIGAPFKGSEEAQGYELTIVLGAGAAALALLGGGAASVDRLIERALRE